MNTEIQELIKSNEDLQEQINEQAKLIKSLSKSKSKTKTNKRWRPNAGGRYWHLSTKGTIMHSDEINHYIDDARWKLGNYFKTKEDALDYKDKQIAQQAIWDALRKHEGDFVANFGNRQDNFFIEYTHREKKFYVDLWMSKQDKPIENYSSAESCRWVIDNMEEELKLVWGIE